MKTTITIEPGSLEFRVDRHGQLTVETPDNIVFCTMDDSKTIVEFLESRREGTCTLILKPGTKARIALVK